VSPTKAFLFVTWLCAACSEAPAAATNSGLSHVEALRPVIACIEERVAASQELERWQGGVPHGPAQSKETLEACARDRAISSPVSDDARDPEQYRRHVLTRILMSFGDYRDHLTVADFDDVMEIARCVEDRATANDNFFGRDPRRSRAAERQALLACAPQISAYAAGGDSNTAKPRRDALIIPIALGNLNYIRATNGRARTDIR